MMTTTLVRIDAEFPTTVKVEHPVGSTDGDIKRAAYTFAFGDEDEASDEDEATDEVVDDCCEIVRPTVTVDLGGTQID